MDLILLGPTGAGPDLKEQRDRRHTHPALIIPRLDQFTRFGPIAMICDDQIPMYIFNTSQSYSLQEHNFHGKYVVF